MRAYHVRDISPYEGRDIWFWQSEAYLRAGWNVGHTKRPGDWLGNLWERLRPQALRLMP